MINRINSSNYLVVVLYNAFQKKTQKTPSGEIEKAKRIMKEYFEQKKGL